MCKLEAALSLYTYKQHLAINTSKTSVLHKLVANQEFLAKLNCRLDLARKKGFLYDYNSVRDDAGKLHKNLSARFHNVGSSTLIREKDFTNMNQVVFSYLKILQHAQ